jgi:transketolase
VEEHTVIGGLGSAVAETLAEANFRTAKRFRRLGIPDVFPEQYGNQDSLMARYDLSTEAIAGTVEQLATESLVDKS